MRVEAEADAPGPVVAIAILAVPASVAGAAIVIAAVAPVAVPAMIPAVVSPAVVSPAVVSPAVISPAVISPAVITVVIAAGGVRVHRGAHPVPIAPGIRARRPVMAGSRGGARRHQHSGQENRNRQSCIHGASPRRAATACGGPRFSA